MRRSFALQLLVVAALAFASNIGVGAITPDEFANALQYAQFAHGDGIEAVRVDIERGSHELFIQLADRRGVRVDPGGGSPRTVATETDVDVSFDPQVLEFIEPGFSYGTIARVYRQMLATYSADVLGFVLHPRDLRSVTFVAQPARGRNVLELVFHDVELGTPPVVIIVEPARSRVIGSRPAP